MALSGSHSYPPAERRLRVGIVGGGTGLVGQWHWTGVRLSNRWDLVAGALSSDPERSRASGREWMLAEDRTYTDYREMAKAEAARSDGIRPSSSPRRTGRTATSPKPSWTPASTSS